MTWRALLAIPFVVSFAILIVLAIVNRRTLFGDRTDDASTYGADEGAWPRVDPAFHADLTTDTKERNLG